MFSLLMLFQACNKEDNPLTENLDQDVVSNEDAADIVAKELSESSGQYGATAVITGGSEIVTNASGNNAIVSNGRLYKTNGDTTIHFENNIPPYSYDFTVTYGYSFILNGKTVSTYHPLADSAQIQFAGNGTFTAPLFTGERDAHTSEFLLFGLKSSSTNLYCKIKYNAETEFTVSEAIPYTLTAKGELVVENIVIDKATGIIKSGNGLYSLTVSTKAGLQKTFEIEVIYLGNQEAKIIFNGTEYTIDLIEGEVIS